MFTKEDTKFRKVNPVQKRVPITTEKAKLQNKCNMPQVVDAIDGTYIHIKTPNNGM